MNSRCEIRIKEYGGVEQEYTEMHTGVNGELCTYINEYNLGYSCFYARRTVILNGYFLLDITMCVSLKQKEMASDNCKSVRVQVAGVIIPITTLIPLPFPPLKKVNSCGTKRQE